MSPWVENHFIMTDNESDQSEQNLKTVDLTLNKFFTAKLTYIMNFNPK